MSKQTTISLIVLFLCMTGCKNTTNPVSSSDQLLTSDLIGKWNKPGYTITFNTDFTFADSTLFTTAFDSTKTQIDTIKRIGKYYVQDGFLFFTDFQITYVGSSSLGISFTSTEDEITIVGNKLRLKYAQVLSPAGNSGGQLYGSWKREGWYCGYVAQDSVKLNNGKFEQNFLFPPDSSKCSYHFTYLTGRLSPREYSGMPEFTYRDSIINIPTLGVYNSSVQFKSGKMLWYSDYPMSELTKVN